jgi:pimeloyl-ACP methyl ester carboxylesterase
MAVTARLRFDIGLLARRLVEATHWLGTQPSARGLDIGFFGSSTGGAAALVAAAELERRVGAVVSRGGRPDLAGAALPRVQSPTLLIVGGLDRVVIGLNEEAFAELRCEKELQDRPGRDPPLRGTRRSRICRAPRSRLVWRTHADPRDNTRLKTMTETFQNRTEAGQLLAAELKRYAGEPNLIILGLPRGGVPVAFEVAGGVARAARCLHRPKAWHTRTTRTGHGRDRHGGVRVINDEVVRTLNIQ